MDHQDGTKNEGPGGAWCWWTVLVVGNREVPNGTTAVCWWFGALNTADLSPAGATKPVNVGERPRGSHRLSFQSLPTSRYLVVPG